MRTVSDEKWDNLLLSFGLDPKYLAEVKSRAENQFGTATKQLDELKKFADENGMDINLVMAQVCVREVFIDLAQAAEKWGEILRTMMKSLPCQQAQYALQDVEAIKMHCDSFIKYGPKPADEEVPLAASVFEPQEQMTLEEYEAHQAKEKAEIEEMMKSERPQTNAEPEAN